MQRKHLLAAALLLAGGAYWHLDADARLSKRPHAPPARKAALPLAPDAPSPDEPVDAGGKPQLGGFVSPDSAATVVCDLPASEKKKNVGGRDGAGLCVFTSIEYCARFQNETRLFDFQRKMRAERGGGWPEKVDQMIAKYAKGVRYAQHTGGDLNFLRLAMRTGRAVGVTYGGSDMHYRGYVAHMVTLAYLDDQWAAITDNNFPGDNELVWMSPAEFEKRWKAGGGGWAVVLLQPPPTPKVRTK
jgi:hypothetical protein